VSTSLPKSYFDRVYAGDADPWKFALSSYEKSKYEATLAALPRQRYASVFEAGCSIGVLTGMLARRCDSLLAVDASEAPLEMARARLADQPQVVFSQAWLPRDWPETGRFDLILLSELLYYLQPDDVSAMAELSAKSLQIGGDLVLVHWRPKAEPPFPMDGDSATRCFIQAIESQVRLVHADCNDDYRLEVWRRL